MAHTLMVSIIDYVMDHAKSMEDKMSFIEVILYFLSVWYSLSIYPFPPCVCVNNALVYV